MTRGGQAGTLIAVAVAAGAAACLLPPIPQDPAYHRFADTRPLWGAPSGWNVLSNLPFLLVGAAGVAKVLAAPAGTATGPFIDSRERWPYAVFFAGIALTAFGSAWYHWAPDTARLVWDRLPMTLGFMGLLSAVVSERLSPAAGLLLLGPLLAAGLGSVLYWRAGELRGAGDLRPYGLVQFLPALLIVLMLWLCPPRYTHGGYLLGALGLYAAGKAAEALDAPVFSLGHVLSGHTLKHVLAALSAWWLLRGLDIRRPRAAEERT